MRRDRDPIARRLRGLDLFAGCSRNELALIAANLTEHRARAGDVLIEEGRTGRELIVLVEGTATVRRGDRVVGRLGPGEVAGEVALLDHGPRTARVVADGPVLALVCTRVEFTTLIDGVPGFARALLPGLARRVRAADDLAM
jgi:CRP-like cAMP-binding protein